MKEWRDSNQRTVWKYDPDVDALRKADAGRVGHFTLHDAAKVLTGSFGITYGMR
jgi:hypothetical protein